MFGEQNQLFAYLLIDDAYVKRLVCFYFFIGKRKEYFDLLPNIVPIGKFEHRLLISRNRIIDFELFSC